MNDHKELKTLETKVDEVPAIPLSDINRKPSWGQYVPFVGLFKAAWDMLSGEPMVGENSASNAHGLVYLGYQAASGFAAMHVLASYIMQR